jgi:hypothetical protein
MTAARPPGDREVQLAMLRVVGYMLADMLTHPEGMRALLEQASSTPVAPAVESLEHRPAGTPEGYTGLDH